MIIDFFKSFLYYHTVKVVQIRSVRLGVLNYVILLTILSYVVVYAIYWKKGYQSTDQLIGNTSVKVKGTSYLLVNSSNINNSVQVWDAAKAVFPAEEPNSFFVTTNFLDTSPQHRSICSGKTNDTKCPCSELSPTDSGIETGECDNSTGFCKLYAWCPLENDVPVGTYPKNILVGVANFTVFIRVTVRFTKYGVIRDNANGTKLTPGYNLFTLEEMVEKTGNLFSEFNAMGGVIIVQVKWDCNFDKSEEECQPKFEFKRVDDPNNQFSGGYNFRYAHHYFISNAQSELTEYRDLFKVYGIRFLFLVTGQAGKFSLVPLLINIGSGLALLSIASLIADFITLYLLPDRVFYRKMKYESVDEESVYNKIKEGNDIQPQEPQQQNPSFLESMKF